MSTREIFTKPILAIIKKTIAEFYTHTTMVILFETYGFEPLNTSSEDNKLKKAGRFLDHINWLDRKNTDRLLNLLTEIYNHHQHLLTDFGPSYNNFAFQMQQLDKTLKNNSIKWDGANFNLMSMSQILDSNIETALDINNIIKEVERLVREKLEGEGTGHDWWHIK